MRQIQELRKLTGGRYLVVLEDGICFPLYKKELGEYSIEEDGILEEPQYQILMEEILPKRAKLRAMHLLQQQDRTEYQLRMKLEAADYPAQIVDTAIAYVKSYHYVDDLRYAVSYIEYHKESRSLRQMEQDLYQRGIPKEVFREAYEQIEMPDEEIQIQELLKKKGFHPGETDQKERERIFRFLLRKGYNMSAVQRVMREESSYE